MKGTKSEQHSRLQDSNKKLRAEVRQLRKKLKQSDDEILLLQELWQSEITELKELKALRRERAKKQAPTCIQCGNPTLDIKQLGVWKLIRCQSCDHFQREMTHGSGSDEI